METQGLFLFAALVATLYLGQRNANTVLQNAKKRFNAWRFLLQGPEMIRAEYKKAGEKAFIVPAPDVGHVFVTSSDQIGEIRRASRDQLSMYGATKQMFQPAYTMLGHNWLDERGVEGIGYIRAIGTLFTRHLPSLMPEMQEIVRDTFDAFLDRHRTKSGGIPADQLAKEIVCNLNGFCFFGKELSQNKHFMKKVLEYNEVVIFTAEVLRLLPEPMKRLIGPYLGRHASVQDDIFRMINDVVAARMERKNLDGDKKQQNDMIQWVIDTAPAERNWTSRRMTYEIIALWFGSVHAVSGTITFMLFDMCAHPEYIEPLREEAEGSEFEEFLKTTKGMPLLDSFMKESSRLHPIEASMSTPKTPALAHELTRLLLVSGRRQALKDFTFSDGTNVKKGDWACIPSMAVLRNEAFFPQSDRFDGFRFAPPENVPGAFRGVAQPEGPSKYTDVSANYHSWGVGGIICPGRFSASVTAKLYLTHILRNLDCSFTDEKKETIFVWRSYLMPREDALVTLTPRVRS